MRAYFKGAHGVDDEIIADARRFGMNDEQIEALRVSLDIKAVFAVWRESWPSLAAFFECDTQWRCAATTAGLVFIGLDYPGAQAGLKAAGIEIDPELWSDIRVLEAEAISVLNER